MSDKGVPAALFMARAMTLLQQLADSGLSPSQLLAELNDELASGNENCMFVTLFCGVLDLDSLQLEFASAGHTPPSLLRNGQANAIAQDSGPALALEQQQAYPANQLQLQGGDRLAIYTDGIDEAFNAEGELFGSESLNRYLGAAQDAGAAELGSGVFRAVDAHAAGTPPVR